MTRLLRPTFPRERASSRQRWRTTTDGRCLDSRVSERKNRISRGKTKVSVRNNIRKSHRRIVGSKPASTTQVPPKLKITSKIKWPTSLAPRLWLRLQYSQQTHPMKHVLSVCIRPILSKSLRSYLPGEKRFKISHVTQMASSLVALRTAVS